jgi:hypothetical protein
MTNPAQPAGTHARTRLLPAVVACLACAAPALAAMSGRGTFDAAVWCATALGLHARRRWSRWLAAVYAAGVGILTGVQLVSLWVSAIAPGKPAQMEWQTARLGALLLGCLVVLILVGVEAWRERQQGRLA